MSTWQQDKRATDVFLPYVKRVLGCYLIDEAPIEDDAQRNTDLIVLTLGAVRVAVRIRKEEYATRYPDQFTIRATRPNGARTELAKIVEGWGDYFFYGFAKDGSPSLKAWSLLRLSVFRTYYTNYLRENAGQEPGDLIPNGDNSSRFRAFDIGEFPPDLVVARSKQRTAVFEPA